VRLRTALLGAATAAASALLAGCGRDGAHLPDAAKLPLPPGASVSARVRSCNPGHDSYCAVFLVIRGGAPRYPNSQALATAEEGVLRRHHWSVVYADFGLEYSELSPGSRLRVIFEPGDHALRLADLQKIMLPRAIQLTLSHAQLAFQPAMAAELQFGPG
jgi:hypothetical protein